MKILMYHRTLIYELVIDINWISYIITNENENIFPLMFLILRHSSKLLTIKINNQIELKQVLKERKERLKVRTNKVNL